MAGADQLVSNCSSGFQLMYYPWLETTIGQVAAGHLESLARTSRSSWRKPQMKRLGQWPAARLCSSGAARGGASGSWPLAVGLRHLMPQLSAVAAEAN